MDKLIQHLYFQSTKHFDRMLVLTIRKWFPAISWRHLRLYLGTLLVAGLVISAFFYVKYQPTMSDSIMPFHYLQEQPHRQRKLILAWTGYWEHKTWLPSLSELNCPISNCEVTYNHSLLANSSAVLFHLANVNLQKLPNCQKIRCNPFQRWVLYHHEPPTQTYGNKMKGLHGKIHWTLTYRSDSDIYAPYGTVLKRTKPYDIPAISFNRSLACWLVSHCKTYSHREQYVAELQKYIPVEIYGKCGKPCGEKGRYECYEWLATRCKFYLSFENSICNEYATEKLFIPMMSTNMVPVVFGGANYSRILPSGSHINIADFAGPKELAEFLVSLGDDAKRYASYLEWKKYFVVRGNNQNWLCDLCRKLHETENDVIVAHKDLYQWWIKDTNCRKWTPKSLDAKLGEDVS